MRADDLIERAQNVYTGEDGLEIDQILIDGRSIDLVMACSPGPHGVALVCVTTPTGVPIKGPEGLQVTEIWGDVKIILKNGEEIYG